MILITGGAGFIGSNLHAALAARGHETIVVDRLRSDGKWHNLAHHPPTAIVAPEELQNFLALQPPIEMVFHLGAISATTATDGDLVWHTNVGLSQELWKWCSSLGVRMIYASSAATYGAGAQGFEDGLDDLGNLRPLNLYGWSKHAFDLSVARAVAGRRKRPPQWVGLKFFNVYGPNEYHKGSQVSVVKVKYDEVRRGQAPRLFRSDRPDVADGEQKRDFIWVGDVVDVLLWLQDTPGVSGLFNVGTGQARSYRDLAHAVCRAGGAKEDIEFIDMPANLRGQYQSFTEARMDRLRAAGYTKPFTSLEDGINRYITEYLAMPDPYV
ncbi:ADP-L-glycero-D-manno-heptose-6-epimerase [Rhodovastum atsumiense]|uniref:ADP-L-glycero-D-manno-heptose-6-epimerase n=1 Tax=Rhodovastum atsumiense TaxID=504468 RepID=A0A5M6ILX6_9PROT|nr:ADP-glyceromanno-heptose 6-epimerase [Rhodovastum atsumiense]KAA5609264.1 ADP-glyceromanno-heptose 6-epimerase [Rhodovastum atsumiense]CAH2601720.1 ADP-L-glycero-D-manno-heptose-6-epimerase [Rhodovastum atsumiense]